MILISKINDPEAHPEIEEIVGGDRVVVYYYYEDDPVEY